MHTVRRKGRACAIATAPVCPCGSGLRRLKTSCGSPSVSTPLPCMLEMPADLQGSGEGWGAAPRFAQSLLAYCSRSSDWKGKMLLPSTRTMPIVGTSHLYDFGYKKERMRVVTDTMHFVHSFWTWHFIYILRCAMLHAKKCTLGCF